MKNILPKSTLLFLCLFSVLIAPAMAKTIVINSQDWKDVYSGVFYADYQGDNIVFFNSPNPVGIFDILPREEILLIDSRNKPYVPNIDSVLESKGFEVSKLEITEGNLELLEEFDIKKFVVIADEYPESAISVGPYAYLTKSWVLVVTSENLDEIKNYLSGADYVVLYGTFPREIKDEISGYADKIISTGNKFEDNVLIAQEFAMIKKSEQVLISDGYSLEEELATGSEGNFPVLLVGKNLFPEETLNFIESEDIKTCIVIGNGLGYIGERIKDERGDDTKVFVKFGQAVAGVSQQIYALNTFQLPLPELNLTITSTYYNPESKKLYVVFDNKGNRGVFAFSTISIKSDGKEITTLSDEETIFLPVGESVSVYDLDLAEIYYGTDLSVVFYTSYGVTEENLEQFVTAKNKFGPPIELPIDIRTDMEEDSEIEILDISYEYNTRFIIKLRNPNEYTIYASVCLEDIPVHGIYETVCSEKVSIPADREREIFIEASLDEIDLETLTQGEIAVKVIFGKNQDLVINSRTEFLELRTVSGLTGYFLMGGSIIGGIIVVSLLVLVLRKKDFRPKMSYSFGR